MLGTRSQQSEQSELQQQQTADPVPCGMLTGSLGPTDDASGTFNVTNSTIASSQMTPTVTSDATTSAETITGGRQPSVAVAAVTPVPSNQTGLWSPSSKFAAEPTSTFKIASSQVKAAMASDATTSAETITPGSSSSFVVATPPAPNSLNGL